jgi:RHS repeat-associated protein
MQQPNGILTHLDYDPRNRVTDITSLVVDFNYDYDAAGNRVRAEEDIFGQTASVVEWTYDRDNRLTQEQRSGAFASLTRFSYDANDNRRTMTVNGQTTSYAYNNMDQLVGVTGVGPNLPMSVLYDARGNRQSVTINGQTTSYAYDAQERLTSLTPASGSSATYAYDHAGRRVNETVGADARAFVWDVASTYGDIVAEFDGTGSLLASYVLGHDRLISQTQGGTTSYFQQDAIGSTRALTNAAGNVTESYTYSAFGTLLDGDTSATPYLYTGHRFDASSGLYQMRARYYDPGVGSFLTQDTWAIDRSNPVELNRYGYVAGNPVGYTDPSGYFIMSQLGALYDNHIKPAALALGRMTRTFAEGAVAGGVGYLVGTLAYAAIRTAVEWPIEQLILRLCDSRQDRPICGMQTKEQSIGEKFQEAFVFAFDLLDMVLTGIYGGVLNVVSSALIANNMPQLNTLSGEDLHNLQTAIRGSLMGYGAATWVTQVITWGIATENDLVSLVFSLGTFSTTVVAGMMSSAALSISGMGRGAAILWSSAVNTLTTALTRTGYSADSIRLNEQLLEMLAAQS